MTGPCENLANAIVMQAVKDYRQARHKLHKRPKNAEAKAMIEDSKVSFSLSGLKPLPLWAAK